MMACASCEERRQQQQELTGKLFARMWLAMHTIALTYPAQNASADEKRGACDYFRGVGWMLPCGDCRTHYLRLYDARFPAAAETSASLFAFTVEAQNDVAARTGKPTRTADETRAYVRSQP